jgi:hypothetical protein
VPVGKLADAFFTQTTCLVTWRISGTSKVIMTPPPGAHVIDEIVVPVVPFAWSVLLIGVALLLVLVVALSDRRR